MEIDLVDVEDVVDGLDEDFELELLDFEEENANEVDIFWLEEVYFEEQDVDEDFVEDFELELLLLEDEADVLDVLFDKTVDDMGNVDVLVELVELDLLEDAVEG